MGGNVFASPTPDGTPGLLVPRMTPQLYFMLRSEVDEILQQFYNTVVVPTEAPEKQDYGDIDFLVSDPVHTLEDAQLIRRHELVGEALRAERNLLHGTSSSYAVQVPSNPAQYYQVDVRFCESDVLPWLAFKQAYGDLWQILGVMIRPCGLTATEDAMYLRVPKIEAEAESRYKSMLFLTNSPREAMGFLGLDYTKYTEGFLTENGVFQWISQSRLFTKKVFQGSNINANDRQKLRKRPMHRRFVTEWLEHANPPDKATFGNDEGVQRDELVEEVLQYFGNRREYDRMLTEHCKVHREKQFFDDVGSMLPLKNEKKNLVLRGLKRWVRFGNLHDQFQKTPFISEIPELDESKQPTWTSESRLTEEELLSWISKNWEDIKFRENERVKLAYNDRKRSRGDALSSG